MTDNTPMEVIKFEKNNIPVAYESKETSDNKYVTYGYDNLYPNYLLGLYNNSPIHASIINAKTTYIIGDGLKYADGKDLDFKVNASDNVKEFADKVIKDYLIFNAFAVEVCFNAFGEPIEYHHVPLHKIRTNKSKTKFWFNDDWTLGGRKNITYDRYTRKNSDVTSKIFYFDGYFPSINTVYSQPEYNGSIKSIATDIAIREFNLNNIKNHFSVSTIITFFQGANVAEEVKRKVIADLKASYTGEAGKKLIVDFQTKDGKPAEVRNLSPNDWDKAYQEVSKRVSDDIFIGHSVTSPLLMGVKTEGQLGGATELETAYEIFKNTYIRVKRDELENALNMLFSANPEIAGKLVFADKPLFNSTLSESQKEKVMTINEIRKEAGLEEIETGNRLIGEPIPASVNQDSAQKMADAINGLSPLVANSVLNQLTINEIRSLAGLPPVEAGDKLVSAAPAVPAPAEAPVVEAEEVKKKSNRKLTEEDYDQIKEMGVLADDFEIIEQFTEELEFDKESDIAQYVIENDIKGLTAGELSALIQDETGVKVPANELRDILNKLHESGVVKVDWDDNGRVKVMPNKTADLPDTDKVSVMYKYEKRPEVEGAALLPTSRSFCTKMINNNRLYTRQEIQQMGALFGYDVYRYAGGFWYDSENDVTHSYCRHHWVSYKVKKRS